MKNIKLGKILCVLFAGLFTLLAFTLMETPAKAVAPDTGSVILIPGTATDQDGGIIQNVHIAKNAAEGFYDLTIVLTEAASDAVISATPVDLSSISFRIDFERSDFLPEATIGSSLYGSNSKVPTEIQTSTGPVTKDIVHITFSKLRKTGEKNNFIFYYTDVSSGISKQAGPFTFGVPESFFTPVTPVIPEPSFVEQSDESSIPERVEVAILTPHLLVDTYSYGGNIITAGQDFNLTFTLKNFAKNKTIENVVIVITPSEGVQLKGNSNTFFVEYITAGTSVTKTVKLKVPISTTADIQAVTISAKFQYYDKKDTDPVSGEDTTILSIPSGKINRAKITSIEALKDFKEGKEGTLEIGFVNNGFSTVYNAEAFLYNEAGEEISWKFIGNVLPGIEAAKTKMLLTFDAGGTQKLKLVICYEDENLVKKQIEKDFAIDIEAKAVIEEPGPPIDPFPPIDPGGEEPMPEGGINPLFIAIPAGLALIGGGTFFAIRKRNKKKQELSYDNYFEKLDTDKSKKPKDGEKAEPDAKPEDVKLSEKAD